MTIIGNNQRTGRPGIGRNESVRILVNNVFFRIHRHPVEPNLIVDMGTGTAPGIAHQSDGLPSLDLFAALF